jgi:hypothetical protein
MTKQPRPIGFPGYPGYPAFPVAAHLCYAIADGCAECTAHAIDEAAGEAHTCAAVIAYVVDVVARGHGHTLPEDLGQWPTRPGSPVPGTDFTDAAKAAFAACPATAAGNGIPAAREVVRGWSPDRRGRALADAVGLLTVYQPRTNRGRSSFIAPSATVPVPAPAPASAPASAPAAA